MSTECPLCTIPQRESLYLETDKIYLVHTKDSKGHKVRVMAATKRHTDRPDFHERTQILALLCEYMSKIMNGHDWYIVDGSHATIPDHYHIIACDAPIEDELDPNFVKTPKVVLPFRRA